LGEKYQRQKERRELPPAACWFKEPVLSSALLTSALLTATLLTATLFFTVALLTFTLLSVSILLLSAFPSGGRGFAPVRLDSVVCP
jgi:hypothetical protein